MANSILTDRAVEIAKLALDGLARRQEVISNNVANIDTPGYRAQNVAFEGALQQAMDRDHPARLRATHPGHLGAPTSVASLQETPRIGGSTRADGNNVDIDVELVSMSETGIRYQAVSRFVSKKLLLLKAIASGR
jgi:flagellar basal-body rod protein FlgB